MPQHGGYREPQQAAPISGPGALSQRTDGPLRGSGPTVPGEVPVEEMRGAPTAGVPIDTSGLVPMEAGTQYPDRAVTDGAVFGDEDTYPGEDEDNLDLTSSLPVLKRIASMPGAHHASRQYVRHLEGQVRQSR